MSKNRLIKRLSWYYPTELFNVFLFTGILTWIVIEYPIADILLLIYGLALMIIILIQGQYYWKLKLAVLKGKIINQKAALKFFRVSKRVNSVLIAIIPIVFFIQFYLNNWTASFDSFMGWALFTNVFGILEYINYYHIQLMIDNNYDLNYLKTNKKLKVAALNKSLRENKI